MGKTGSSTDNLPPEDFAKSVANLFRLNNYEVEENIFLHGAQLDITARSKTDKFAPTIYIEATVEYVDNTKYGKDTTKFLLVRSADPRGTCLCVSSKGFTGEVKERARASGVQPLMYSELFHQFEQFSPYVDHVLGDTDLKNFSAIYEEPQFSDKSGEDKATDWLTSWRTDDEVARWLIVLGEYGTGKTALTRVLQRRWLDDYARDAANPIPFRIELRNFSRQFDARTLIHYFLDTNSLGHLSIDFVFFLIRQGRILLLLDGYDEMAQFLNPRERRACLAALAELARDGAKGILTSRPNYFSETEELRVFEALYDSIVDRKYYLGADEKSLIDMERGVDSLVSSYMLNRHERYLRDLTPTQTESLIKRKLEGDADGQRIILGLLQRVFRADAVGSRQALSGKPVIITYLMELVDDLRVRDGDSEAPKSTELSEWQIYKLIVDRLMLRDFQRSTLGPEKRRRFLQQLAVVLSSRDTGLATNATFHDLIDREFRQEFRLMDPEEKTKKREELFEDLRTSATLTRTEAGRVTGWQFSHNSLREYLVAEYMINGLIDQNLPAIPIPISQAMRNFVATIPEVALAKNIQHLSDLWILRSSRRDLGTYLRLLWTGLSKLSCKLGQPPQMLCVPKGSLVPLDCIRVADIAFEEVIAAGVTTPLDCQLSDFSEVSFNGLDLQGSNFSGATLDACSFRNTKLSGAKFDGAWLFECDITDADVAGADFSGLEAASSVIVRKKDEQQLLFTGGAARGYLAYYGGKCDQVTLYEYWQHHPKFSIALKICKNVIGQKKSQLRGLTQRGEAHQDPPFARAFVQYLEQQGLIGIDQNELVSATSTGREVLPALVEHEEMHKVIAAFFDGQ